MNKKPKATKKISALKDFSLKSPMEQYLKVGNFFMARKEAHLVLSSSPSADQTEAAHRVLKITWPDPVALLMGLLCLSFSIVIAFLVS